MRVDNAYYDRAASSWWQEHSPLYALHPSANPARLEYVLEVLEPQVPGDAPVLDLGSGGGFISEALAQRGYRVSGIDPSEASVHAARVHASAVGLRVDYTVGYGEALPHSDAQFAAVVCLDALEHVNSVDTVIAQVARVLRPGGVFVFDTINRTLKSRFVMAFLLQDFPWTRLAPKQLHDPRLFVKPAELHTSFKRHRLEPRALIGMAPTVDLWTLVRALRACKLGQITPAETFRRARIAKSADTSISYMGWARKPG